MKNFWYAGKIEVGRKVITIPPDSMGLSGELGKISFLYGADKWKSTPGLPMVTDDWVINHLPGSYFYPNTL